MFFLTIIDIFHHEKYRNGIGWDLEKMQIFMRVIIFYINIQSSIAIQLVLGSCICTIAFSKFTT